MAIRNIIVRGYGPGATIPFIVTRGYSIGGAAPSASVSVSIALTEPLLVAGGEVITITLTADTWVASGAAFDQVRQIIIDGIVSAQSEVNGWNVQRSNIAVTDLVRTSNDVATLTLPALAGFDITVDELLTDTVPDEALVTSTTPVVATPTFGIMATAPLLAAHTVTFKSVSNTTVTIKDTPQLLGFLLTEDGGILLQENDLPIALE